MIITCKTCGCVYEDTIESHYELDEEKYYEAERRDCPLCKLRDELPSILDDLEDKVNKRGIYSPEW